MHIKFATPKTLPLLTNYSTMIKAITYKVLKYMVFN